MAGVSDTLGFLSDLGTPRRQAYQIHFAFLPHLGTPKWQVYQMHMVFYPILAPQNGRCIRYTWFSIPSWHPKTAGVSDTLGFDIPSWLPKMAGVSDTLGFLSDLCTPRRQAYQIHLVFYPIFAPQNGRCIRCTRFSIPSWHPKMATVSDTPGFLSHLGTPKWQAPQHGNCIRYSWCKGVLKDVLCKWFLVLPNAAPATKSDNPTSER